LVSVDRSLAWKARLLIAKPLAVIVKMKKIITSLLIVTVLCGCSERPHKEQVSKDTWESGRPKQMVLKTTNKDTYYNLELDSIGRIKEIIPYSNGQVNGTQIYFRDNMEVGALINFENGEREGYVFEFRPKLYPGFKGLAKSGKFNGESTWYFENGQPEDTGNRIDDKKEGQWTEYYENGQVKGQGSYVNGKKQDDWTYWNEDGTLDTLKE
jgi:antitoxin component YwqK of YwqJK toxin-antitoxin module